MSIEALKPHVQNGKDYTLEFDGPYDSPARQEELSAFIEQAFERMPELAEKVLKAREISGLVPKIIFTDDTGDYYDSEVGAGSASVTRGTIWLNPDQGESGIYDADKGCVSRFTLVRPLAHELAHIADENLWKSRLKTANMTDLYEALKVAHRYESNVEKAWGFLFSPPTSEQYAIMEKNGCAQLSLDELKERKSLMLDVIGSLNRGARLEAEPVAVRFADFIMNKYGSKYDLPMREAYENGYEISENFRISSILGGIDEIIDEAKRVYTGNDATRVSPLFFSLSHMFNSEKQYPQQACQCAEDQQPDVMWLPKQ